MADDVNARESAGDGSSFTRVTQDYDEDLEANRGAETSVYLADDDAVGRKSATYAAARKTSTKWPPNVKLASPRAGAPPLGGHFVEVPVAAA